VTCGTVAIAGAKADTDGMTRMRTQPWLGIALVVLAVAARLLTSAVCHGTFPAVGLAADDRVTSGMVICTAHGEQLVTGDAPPGAPSGEPVPIPCLDCPAVADAVGPARAERIGERWLASPVAVPIWRSGRYVRDDFVRAGMMSRAPPGRA